MSVLSYDVFVSGLLPARLGALPTGEPALWSPLSHTLIHGPSEAAVVDPPITVRQADALADWIAGFGKPLTHIYITHWHADHWLSTTRLAERFPGVTVYASSRTVQRIKDSTPGGVPGELWTGLFPGQLVAAPIEILARPVPQEGFRLDGELLVPVEAGHSDTDDSTVLHVPSIGLVAAGDVVYNNVHQYLAETGDGGGDGWHRALDVVAALAPRNVVAGHKDATRDDSPATIDETRRYLDETLGLLAAGPTREEFFARVLERFPEHVNPTTVWLSALRLIPG